MYCEGKKRNKCFDNIHSFDPNSLPFLLTHMQYFQVIHMSFVDSTVEKHPKLLKYKHIRIIINNTRVDTITCITIKRFCTFIFLFNRKYLRCCVRKKCY